MSNISTIQNRLVAGDTAPSFEVNDVFDQPVRLSQKPVLLSFFRNSACALCNLRVHQLIKRYPEYQARGLEMIAVFESSRENILQYVGKQDAPFSIIANPTAELYNLYGVEVSEEKINATMVSPETHQRVQEAASLGFALVKEEGSNFFRLPAEFLIGADGRIHTAFYSDRIGDHIGFDVIDAFLK